MVEEILRTEYSGEMQRNYMNYFMSVITARATPDARDGLKPVQRRVLHDMNELYLDYDKLHRKSACIVGDTMGKYHPHGDNSIYETLVAMSQDFKKGMALVNGHGSFGSIKGDGAAAMRYTKARLEKLVQEVYLEDLDKTVSFMPNYGEMEKEPEVLPVYVPNLLINRAEDIVVDMNTSIPPHNLSEIVDAVRAYINDPEISIEQLMEHMSGPDFPTDGIIANKGEFPGIYKGGVDKTELRDRFKVELGKRKVDKNKLVITEISYTMIGVGTDKMLAGIAGLVGSKELIDMVDIPNQSNRDRIRIVLELCRDADIDKTKNILYKKTKLKDTPGVSMLAIMSGRPETLNLKGILRNFLNFQYENTECEYNVLLQRELDKGEVQEGLIMACDCINPAIAVLRGAKNLRNAKICLMFGGVLKIQSKVPGLEEDAEQLHFTERRASTILRMCLHKLIGLETLALEKEYKETLRKIAEYKRILGGRDEMNRMIRNDLVAIRKGSSVPKRTLIEDGPEAFYDETAIAIQEMIFVLDWSGYCKLLDRSTYKRNQETVDIKQVHAVRCLNMDKICLFASSGNLYQIKAADMSARKLRDKETPTEGLSKYDGTKDSTIYLTSTQGPKDRAPVFAAEIVMVKQVPAKEFETSNRMMAVTELQENNRVVTIVPVRGRSEVALQITGSVFLQFPLEKISVLKKTSRDARRIKPAKDEELENLYLIGEDPVIEYKGREVHMNRLKITKRSGKGSKARLQKGNAGV